MGGDDTVRWPWQRRRMRRDDVPLADVDARVAQLADHLEARTSELRAMVLMQRGFSAEDLAVRGAQPAERGGRA
jgi:hypothetical protein